MKRIGFYAGTFDPFTRGHLAIVCEALASYDELIVAVGTNDEKKPMFDVFERVRLIEQSVSDFVDSYLNRGLNRCSFSAAEKKAAERLLKDQDCLMVKTYGGLTVDAALRFGATALIRGERIIGDHDAELQLAMINQQLLNVRHCCLEMVLIPVPKEKLTYISSSMVKKLCAMGEYIAAMRYVTPSVHEALAEHYLGKNYLSSACGSSASWTLLKKAYSAENRVYHSLSHIAYGLNYVNILFNVAAENALSADQKQLLEQALLWHDFYCGQPDAEEASAMQAEEILAGCLECRDIVTVKKLIMATKHGGNERETDWLCQIMHDVDLAILGDNANYGAYAQGIRQEYAHIPAAEYAKGRIAVLQNFLNADSIYQMEFFSEMFGETAKKNLRQEIAFWQLFI